MTDKTDHIVDGISRMHKHCPDDKRIVLDTLDDCTHTVEPSGAASDHVVDINEMIKALLEKHKTPWSATRDIYLGVYGAIMGADGNIVTYGSPKPLNQQQASLIMERLMIICHLANSYAARQEAGKRLVDTTHGLLSGISLGYDDIWVDKQCIKTQAALEAFKAVM